jgi:hypothetical protein
MHLQKSSFALLLLLGMAFTGPSKIFAEPVERKFVTSERLYLGTQKNSSASIRIGDLDGDTNPDIVVANGRQSK